MRMILCSLWKGRWRKAKNLSALLDVFADCSGLRLNRKKSEFTGVGISQDEESQCSRALGTPMGTLPIRYLGLPLSTGQLRGADWQSVVGKVEQRLEGWKAKVLSKGGRLVLLKSVLSAIPTFYLSVFKIPASIEQHLSHLMRRFFWKGWKEGRGLALVAWDDICKPTGRGGLGVPHLKTMNVALLTKWLKRIIGPEEDVIRAMMRDRYGAGGTWAKMTTRVRGASAFWRGLGKVVPIIQKFFAARLGDSALFWFWLDEWSDKGCLRGKFPRLFAVTRHPQGTVKECWDGGWNPSFAAHLSEQRLGEFMSMQQMLEGWRPREGARDGWIWRNEQFSVRGLYQQLRTSQSDDPVVLDACRALEAKVTS